MKIKDLCSYAPKSRIKAGEAVENAKYLFFTSSADENKRYTDFQFDKEAIIMGTGGNATLHYYNGKFSVSTDCLVLFPNSKIKCKYLYYFFKSHMSVLEAGFKGAGLKHTIKKYIEEINVSKVPDLSTQEKIVSHLDTITENIEKLNRELELFDSLTKARFIEMFGRPFINNMNWESRQIKNVVNEVKYGTSKPSVENGEYKYLRMNNLTYDGRFDLTDLKFISLDNDELEKCVVRKGDVLFNRTNSLALIGKTADFDFDEDMVIAGYIIRIRLKETIVPKFFSMYMNTDEVKLHLRTIAKGAVNQANINAQELQGIPIYIPPIELQQQFADFVKQVDKSREEVKKSLEKTQQLYDSLMQEYFG